MRVHFLLDTKGELSVHKENCAHIERAKRTHTWNNDWVEELSEGKHMHRAAVESMNSNYGWDGSDPDEKPPWSLDDIRMMPCLGKM